MQRAHVVISGFVQGIAYRAFIKQKADMLNLKGYAKNLQSGDVEAIFEGEEPNIKEMLQICKTHQLAKVNNITIKEEKPTNKFKEFNIF